MENKIVEANANEVMTDLDLHEKQIINQMNIAVQTVFEIGKLLKAIRDGKEYAARGIKSFKEYMDEDTGKPFKFGYTQANKYIQVYERYSPMQDKYKNIQLDVLYELRIFSDDELDRVEGLDKMNADEANQLRKQLEAANEQITLLQSTVEEKDGEIDGRHACIEALKEEKEALESEIEHLKSEPVNAALDNAKKEIAKVKKELKAKAKEEQDKAVCEAIDKERKALAAEKDKAVKDATKELKNQVEGYKKKLEAQQENMSEAVKKASELEEKLKAARTDNSLKFRLLFEQFQNSLENIFDVLDTVENKKEQAAFAEKLTELGGNISETAKEYC